MSADFHHNPTLTNCSEMYSPSRPTQDSLQDSSSAHGRLLPADTLFEDSGTLFDTYSPPTTAKDTSWSPSASTDVSPEGWVSPLKSCFDAMVLEPACEYTDLYEAMEVVDDGDEEVDDPIVELIDIDNIDISPSGVVCWSGSASLKAVGVCPSLLLPSPRLGFREVVHMDNIAWADKARGIVQLSRLQGSLCRFPIICRLTGFGKTSFLTMLKSFHDICDDEVAPAEHVFKQTSVDCLFNRKFGLSDFRFQKHLILSFSLSNLDISSTQRFKENLLDEIDCALSDFIWRYGYLLDQDGSKRVDPAIFDSVGRFDLFGALLEWLIDCDLPVFLIVDNYDSAQRASSGDSQITDILWEHFILPLAHISNKSIHRGIIVGQATPIELRQRCGRDIWTLGEDRSRDYRIATAFGLTKSEIRQLCITFGLPGLEEEIFASLPGHCFSNHPEDSVYCTRAVLEFLRRQPALRNRRYIESNNSLTKEQLLNGMSSTAM